MYSVEIDQLVLDQVAALPAKALVPYAELMMLLEVAPWSGDTYNRQRPDANMLTYAFGDHDEGLAVYLVLDAQRRVVVLRVMWAG